MPSSIAPKKHNAVVVTAISPEYRAVRAHLVDVEEVRHPQGTVYEKGLFRCPNGQEWSVAIVESGAGNPTVAIETERAVTHFGPSVVIFVGVAGGIKDVKLCDVVAATKVYGYESGKSLKTFEPRPNVGQSSYSMIQRARAEARKERWLDRLDKGAYSQTPRVHVAPIAAGEKVIASKRSQIWSFLRSTYSDAVAVEMEGRGFLDAAHANPQVSALIVRGISDLVSSKTQSDRAGYQELAARTASAFAFEILANLENPITYETGQYIIVFSGTIDEVDRARAEAIVAHLRQISEDGQLTLTRIEKGSVKFILTGSRDGFDRLQAFFKSGGLSKELGIDIVDMQWIGVGTQQEGFETGMQATIEQWLPEAKRGSREALNHVFEAVYPYVSRLAQMYLRRRFPSSSWMDADDVVLDALLAAYKGIERFTGTTVQEFLAWIRVVVIHEARAGTQMAYSRQASAMDLYLDDAAASSNLVQNLERLESTRMIERALESLTEREREIIRLRFFDNLTYREIAERLAITTNLARVATYRATQKIRQELQEPAHENE